MTEPSPKPGSDARGELHRLAAFTDTPTGGNPAGVWIGPTLPRPAEMRRLAAAVGFSETAFLARRDDRTWTTRYYSPEDEVSFCGHASIAAGILLAAKEGPGTYVLATAVGDVPVEVRDGPHGRTTATLTSVEPSHRPVASEVLDRALTALHWSREDLDASIPPAVAYAGAWHLILAVAHDDTLRSVDLDAAFDDLKSLMAAEGLTTLQLVWRRDAHTFSARNPFPPGGVVEDPATGAAAAALGGYLRAIGAVGPPADLIVHQGHEMGRPSLLEVHIPRNGGIEVGGMAVILGD